MLDDGLKNGYYVMDYYSGGRIAFYVKNGVFEIKEIERPVDIINTKNMVKHFLRKYGKHNITVSIMKRKELEILRECEIY